MSVWETIRTKRSIRKFENKPLSDEELQRILEAGRRCQSGFNSQPWRFIVVTERDLQEKLSNIGNSTKHMVGSAMAVMLLSPHAEKSDRYWQDMFDVGQAAAYMQLTAAEMGIGSCPGSVVRPEIAREVLGFPDDWDLKLMLSFGYPDKDEYPDRPPKQGTRKTFDEVVHFNGWSD